MWQKFIKIFKVKIFSKKLVQNLKQNLKSFAKFEKNFDQLMQKSYKYLKKNNVF